MLTESQSTVRCQHFRGRQNGHLEESKSPSWRAQVNNVSYNLYYVQGNYLLRINTPIQFCFLGLWLTGYLVFVLVSTYIYRSIIQVARLVVIAH